MGGPHKPAMKLAGWPLLDHVLLAVSGAFERVVVGSPRISHGSPQIRKEDTPQSRPGAGKAAAMDRISQESVVVLAADLPFIGPGLDQLRTELGAGRNDAAVLVDTTGRLNFLASVWRTSSLRAALARTGNLAGIPVRALYEGMTTAKIPDFDGHGADCDIPEDLRTARLRITKHHAGLLPASPLAWPRLDLHSPG